MAKVTKKKETAAKVDENDAKKAIEYLKEARSLK